ncbi:hypothetical protein [Rhodococcus koreensis]
MSTVTEAIDVAGQVGEFDTTITELHADERVAWNSDSGPNHAGVTSLHRLGDEKTWAMPRRGRSIHP